ncbi:MAG: ParB/RepB/Spo0J family partition protein [Planctomycetaceae bacterium]|nr:ParB/RepB/Spo0J family partition protein [Planctomycetaceae bacterium]
MGVRSEAPRAKLSPLPRNKDVGRGALRTYGTLETSQVIPDPEQPRTEFDQEQLERLAQSIRDKGQLAPIRVRWSEFHGKWIIVCGERRYRATLLAGLKTIECHFQEGELSSTEIMEQQLIENLLREDLKPIEEAKAFQQLIQINGWTGKELADALRITQSRVSRAIALLKLPEDIQQQVEAGSVSAGAAYELSKLDSHEQQRAVLAKGLETGQEATVATVQKKVRERRGKPAPSRRGLKQTFVSESGVKVIVLSNRKVNYHEIEQAMAEALEEVRLRIENNVQIG